MKEKNIAIVGGGITGLTTALCLRKSGISCQVFERAPEIMAVGAGIWMAPNAMKIFDWLGIKDEVARAGISIQSVEITDRKLRSFRPGNTSFIKDDHENWITSIHRAKLLEVLKSHLPDGTLQLGKAYERHSIENNKVNISFTNLEVQADVLLAADGIHSKVRNALFPASRLRYSGQTCWRGVARIQLPEEFRDSAREAWGHKIRFGFSVISPESVYWFAVLSTPEGGKDNPSEDIQSKLLELYSDFNPLISSILSATPRESIIRNDIHDLQPLPHWHVGNICLMGDAGHATTPNMGQGGAQGIEDAYYMSNILSQVEQIDNAFDLFEKARMKKVNNIVNNSKFFGDAAHHPLKQWLVKNAMKITPEAVLKKQMASVYDVQIPFKV